jgi:hypothetical protein
MCEYLRGGAGEGPSGHAGRPFSPSADRPVRRLIVAVAAAAIAASLATFWASQGQFRGW